MRRAVSSDGFRVFHRFGGSGLSSVVEDQDGEFSSVLHCASSAARNFHSTMAVIGLKKSRSDLGLGGTNHSYGSSREEYAGSGLNSAESRFNDSLNTVSGDYLSEDGNSPLVHSDGNQFNLITATGLEDSGGNNSLTGELTVTEAGLDENSPSLRGENELAASFQACFSSQLLCEEAAVKIQTLYRGFAARRHYIVLRGEIISRRCEAAAKIQAFYKGLARRRQYQRDKISVIRIQASIRKLIVLRWYRCLRETVRKMERVFLARKSRRLVMEEHSSVTIQAYFRGFYARLKLKLWNDAARKIQNYWKAYVNRRANIQMKHIEDWNTVAVEHLDQCLDTCLVNLHPLAAQVQQVALHIPKSDPVLEDSTHNYRQALLRDKRLKQVARVFLLQHHIAIQQQRGKVAPPFPPSYPKRGYKYSKEYTRGHDNTESSGDIILDVQCLTSSMYIQDDIVDNEAQSHALKQLNALLVVFVAVVVYTKTICRGVFLWASNGSS